jgi:hypothetical protein
MAAEMEEMKTVEEKEEKEEGQKPKATESGIDEQMGVGMAPPTPSPIHHQILRLLEATKPSPMLTIPPPIILKEQKQEPEIN